MKSCFLILLLFTFGSLAAQENNPTAFYWVTFSDKGQNVNSLDRPEDFLSPRAIQRRQRHGAPVTIADLPVDPGYLEQIRAAGAKIHHTSRWLNAATVLCSEDKFPILQAMPFVQSVEFVGKYFSPAKKKSDWVYKDSLSSNLISETPYGYAFGQISMLQGDSLHKMGFRGQGMLIAVLDGGFDNSDVMPFFDSLRLHDRLKYHQDFVDGDDFVFESSSHGSQVLSLMGANIPGLMVGTAPEAIYACLKTEDVRGEYRVEECNWIAGLEYADSLGADVVNSSLGYSTFSDIGMDYTYNNMDGRTSISSRAADLAFERGMIVVTSAGNEGASKWKHITAPADAINTLTIGSVDSNGDHSKFSSKGPSADGRIKPDVAAPGSWTPVAATSSFRVTAGSGTSFSAPIVAGLVACLWQAFPEKTNREIIEAIKKSAHQYDSPDYKLGYGIPDFARAFSILNQNY